MNATVILLLIVAAYFLPALIALIRSVPNAGSVVVVNLFLGWTLLGWVASLAMAARSSTLKGTHSPSR